LKGDGVMETHFSEGSF